MTQRLNSVRRPKRFYVKERHNPQLGVYYVACGQLSKAAARRMETRSPYGYNVMRGFDTAGEYNDYLAHLREKGEKVQ